TTAEEPTFFNRSDPAAPVPSPHGRTFRTALDPLYTNRYESREFTREALELGVNCLGVCCGAAPPPIPEVAETAGLATAATRFSERMENHSMYGSTARLPEHIVGLGGRA